MRVEHFGSYMRSFHWNIIARTILSCLLLRNRSGKSVMGCSTTEHHILLDVRVKDER